MFGSLHNPDCKNILNGLKKKKNPLNPDNRNTNTIEIYTQDDIIIILLVLTKYNCVYYEETQPPATFAINVASCKRIFFFCNN